MTSLHLGCGPTKKLGDVGVDILPGPAVDVVHDLDATPWPLPDDAFDRVIATDVFEHLARIPQVMEQLHRVTTDGAVTEIRSPCAGSPDLFTDPTHLRPFGHRSFDYFDPSSDLFAYGYSGARFRVRRFWYEGQQGRGFGPLDRLALRLANARPKLFEERLCYLLRLKAIHFELVTLK